MLLTSVSCERGGMETVHVFYLLLRGRIVTTCDMPQAHSSVCFRLVDPSERCLDFSWLNVVLSLVGSVPFLAPAAP